MLGTVEQQIEFEEAAKAAAVDKYIDNMAKGIKEGRFGESAESLYLIRTVLPIYVNALDQFFATKYATNTEKYKQLLMLMHNNTSELALLVLREVFSEVAKNRGCVSVSTLSLKIVKQLQSLSLYDNLVETNPKFIAYLGKEFRRATRKRKDALIKKHIEDLELFDINGKDKPLAAKAGALLINVLKDSGVNLITIETERVDKTTKTVVRITDEAKEALLKCGRGMLSNILFQTNLLPMIVEPIDVDDSMHLGFLKSKIPLIKTHLASHRQFLKGKKLPKMYPVINKLNKTAWKFNSRVVDVIVDIFENNLLDPKNDTALPKLIGGLPTSDVYNVNDIVRKDDYGVLENGWEIGKEHFHKYIKDKNEMTILLDQEFGKRLSLVFALNVYTKMCDFDRLYFPHQLDYRGRLYTYPAFVSIQQPSFIKAMLQFSDEEHLTPLGEQGLWIHAANSYGIDKELFDVRVKWTQDNIQEILASAEDPLGNTNFWGSADSPFEFLAACFAIKDHLDGKPIGLPMGLDATCSGIQVYSVIMKDFEGCLAVNVVGDKRNDIYGQVAAKVNSYLEKGDYPEEFTFTDSAGDTRTVGTIVVARSMTGKVTRSIVKRNTMTVPYSVTFMGMQMQLKTELDDLKFKGKAFWEGEDWVAIRLLATLNMRAIYEVVKGARIGQEYFKALARNLDTVATWNTPIYNFPVFQPVFKDKIVRVQTVLGSFQLLTATTELDKRWQSNAIAPNIIHSLDSTLLCGTVDRFEGSIGVVHDNFLVHPNNWRQVQKCYKESFVELLEADPLVYIGEQLDPEGVVAIPIRGELSAQEMLDAEYAVS